MRGFDFLEDAEAFGRHGIPQVRLFVARFERGARTSPK